MMRQKSTVRSLPRMARFLLCVIVMLALVNVILVGHRSSVNDAARRRRQTSQNEIEEEETARNGEPDYDEDEDDDDDDEDEQFQQGAKKEPIESNGKMANPFLVI